MKRAILAASIVALALPLFALADGSQQYTTPGTYTFTVPTGVTSITVQAWGAGGGGGGGFYLSYAGGGGGYSKQTINVSDLPSTVQVAVGSGGLGGASNGYASSYVAYGAGQPGTAGGSSSFGTFISASGGGGGDGSNPNDYAGNAPVSTSGAGGNGLTENGGNGGGTPYDPSQNNLLFPGNFASVGDSTTCSGAGGGSGGNAWPPGETAAVNPTESGGTSGCGGNGGGGGATLSTTPDGAPGTIPGGGGGGGGEVNGYSGGYDHAGNGGNGAPGEVEITWTGGNSSGPSCAISFSPSTWNGDSSTMTWTSSDATLFYINNVGYVSGSGSATVYSAGDYSGNVSGPDGTASCPATLGDGTSLTENGNPVSACDIGYTQQGNVCVFTACPLGYLKQGNQCIFSTCPQGYTDQSGECVETGCTAGPICQNGNLYEEDASCNVSSTKLQSCSYGCSGTQCLPPPSPEIATWKVIPLLVKSEESTNVSWSASNVASCAITGTDGDSWTGLSGSKTSLPLTTQTTFSILCQGLPGAVPSTAASTTVVNIAPSFNEQ